MLVGCCYYFFNQRNFSLFAGCAAAHLNSLISLHRELLNWQAIDILVRTNYHHRLTLFQALARLGINLKLV